MNEMKLLFVFLRDQVAAILGSYAELIVEKDTVEYRLAFCSVPGKECVPTTSPPEGARLTGLMYIPGQSQFICRSAVPVWGLDGTHSLAYKGIFSTVNVKFLGKDITVAFCFMEKEENSTLVPFLQKVKEMLPMERFEAVVRDQGKAEKSSLEQVQFYFYSLPWFH